MLDPRRIEVVPKAGHELRDDARTFLHLVQQQVARVAGGLPAVKPFLDLASSPGKELKGFLATFYRYSTVATPRQKFFSSETLMPRTSTFFNSMVTNPG